MQEGDNLPAGTGRAGREVAAASSAGDFVVYRPRYGLRIVRIGGNIGEVGLCGRRGASCRLPQVFHGHGAGTIGVRSEVRTGHQTLFSGSQSRLIEVIGGFNIREGIRRCRLRGTVRALQEGQNLRLTASCAGREGGRAGAASDFLLRSPQNRVSVVVIGFYIGEVSDSGRIWDNGIGRQLGIATPLLRIRLVRVPPVLFKLESMTF